MIDKTKKNYFVWNSRYPDHFSGFYYTKHREIIEDNKKGYYTEEEIEKSKEFLSPSVFNRIKNMRMGTHIVLASVSRSSEIAIRRLTDDEVDLILQKEINTQEIKNIKEEINKYIPRELKEKLLELEKQQRKLNKKKNGN